MKWIAFALILLAGLAQAADRFAILRATETVTITSTQQNSVQFGDNMRLARIMCSATCWVGSAATNLATVISNPVVLLPGETEQIAVSSGGYVLVLKHTTTTAGTAYVTPIEPR